MSEIKTNDSELFQELSEREQEAVAGGFGLEDLFASFFFQKTDIDTFADAKTHLPNGASASHSTGYKSSQITLAFTLPLSGGRRSRFGHSRMGNIFNLFRDYWGG